MQTTIAALTGNLTVGGIPRITFGLIMGLTVGLGGTIVLAQSVPGFTVSTYASDVPGPVYIAFAPDGVLYCGRDVLFSGNIEPRFITRIGPGGSPVESYGLEMTPDPDPVVVDVAGVVSGVPGSVMTGGVVTFQTVGSISAIRPDGTVEQIWISTSWVNPSEMKFDHTGRFLFGDTVTRSIWQSVAGEFPTPLFTLPGSAAPAHLTIAPDNRIFVSDFGGRVYSYASDGTLLNGNVATLPSRVSIEFGQGGAFGTTLYALRLSTGTLHTISERGTVTQIGTSLGTQIVDLAFGPDQRLYYSRFGAGQITVIEPATCFCDPTKPADINCSGTVDGADLGILLSAWGTTTCEADLNGDGIVNGGDLGLLLAAWGARPLP